ncbi:MAG: glycosyltransferase family protein [Pseudonocardiaceae bacterium]
MALADRRTQHHPLRHSRPHLRPAPPSSSAGSLHPRPARPHLVWDKDLQLPGDHVLRHAPHVTVCEAGLHPGPGAARLWFPVADTTLEGADPAALAALHRDLPLVYVGNQYDRDEPFDRYFAPVAATAAHLVAGKWTDTRRWPQVHFMGRIPFADVERLYRRALATMLLAPDRLVTRGQFTQRIFEAVLAGCVPIAPAYLRAVEKVVPPELITRDADQALTVLGYLATIAGGSAHAELIGRCLTHLAPFRLSRQLSVLSGLLDQAVSPSGVTR